MRGAVVLAALLLSGCATNGSAPADPYPPPGITMVVEGPIAGADGKSLASGTINLAPDGEVGRHVHDGEEFLVVTGGSATLFYYNADWSQLSSVTLVAGQGIRIAPGTVHWAKAGPQGARATASWVVIDGQPLRRDVATPAGS